MTSKNIVKNKTSFYDIIIIGGGIAGLYTALKIKQSYHDISFIILERDSQNLMGGRTRGESFCGVDVQVGAGVGRKRKDKLLCGLLKQLDIKTKQFEHQIQYSRDLKKYSKNIVSDLQKLNHNISPNTMTNQTFSQYAIDILGREEYDRFVRLMGYSDFDKDNALEVIENYGLDDNVSGNTIFRVPWNQLIIKLIDCIGWDNIVFSQEVKTVSREMVSKKIPSKKEKTKEKIKEKTKTNQPNKNTSSQFIVITNNNQYYCNNVILATRLSSLRNLVPSSLYRDIEGQPFLRVYARVSETSKSTFIKYCKNTTIVRGPLQKIIPINEERGIYMIAYCDNQHAVKLQYYTDDTPNNRLFYENLLREALGCGDDEPLDIMVIRGYYWCIGTHYYNRRMSDMDLEKLQNPEEGIFVVGEVVGRTHGWVESALESVENMMPMLEKKLIS